jgi:hypothetical protein
MSLKEAGVQASATKATATPKYENDIAGTAGFCFGLLTFSFVGLLIVCAFGGVEHDLPLRELPIGRHFWPVYSFGLIAVVAVISGSLVKASFRAFQLQKMGLLSGYAKYGYFLCTSVDVPLVLGILAEVAIVSSGLLILAVTGSYAVLYLCLFCPIIVFGLAYSYSIWKRNDYELVIWPPSDSMYSLQNDSPSDLETAFHMVSDIFGKEEETEFGTENDVPESTSPPDTGERDNPIDSNARMNDVEFGGQVERRLPFTLPNLDQGSTNVFQSGNPTSTTLKMPPLPLKSVLRRQKTVSAANPDEINDSERGAKSLKRKIHNGFSMVPAPKAFPEDGNLEIVHHQSSLGMQGGSDLLDEVYVTTFNFIILCTLLTLLHQKEDPWLLFDQPAIIAKEVCLLIVRVDPISMSVSPAIFLTTLQGCSKSNR